jgi:hypothetical protein
MVEDWEESSGWRWIVSGITGAPPDLLGKNELASR